MFRILSGNRFTECGAVVGQRHMDEAEEIEAHRFAIDHGDVARE